MHFISHIRGNVRVRNGKKIELFNIEMSRNEQVYTIKYKKLDSRQPVQYTFQEFFRFAKATTFRTDPKINSRSSHRAQGYQLASPLLSEKVKLVLLALWIPAHRHAKPVS